MPYGELSFDHILAQGVIMGLTGRWLATDLDNGMAWGSVTDCQGLHRSTADGTAWGPSDGVTLLMVAAAVARYRGNNVRAAYFGNHSA